MSTIKVNNLQNASGGSNSTPEEIEQGRAKAWVNFNGRNTPSIREDYNVSSITDLGTGNYRVTFSNAMANANYTIAGSACELGGGGNNDAFFGAGRSTNYSDLHTTTSCTVTVCSASGSNSDRDFISAIIFGDD
tara:strand:+ start:422 stop:823 length:402 start_codon:yes stop_codon:yes gene_type:complete